MNRFNIIYFTTKPWMQVTVALVRKPKVSDHQANIILNCKPGSILCSK
jgi:hypothetical protein